MTRLCPLPEDDSLRPGRVAIEVDVRPGATTIVIQGELDLATMPVLAEQLVVLARDQPGRDALHGLRSGAADRRVRPVAA